MIDVFNSLGISVTWSEELLKKCQDILETLNNYKMPMSDFVAMMEDIDNYHLAQKRKKLEKLLSECSNTQVVLDPADSTVIEECSREIELFNCSLRECPKIFLPIFRHFPWYMLHRKRVYKRLLKVKQKLDEIVDKKVKNVSCETKELFFVMFMILMHCASSELKSKIVTSINISGLQIFQTKDYLKLQNFDVPNMSWVIVYKKIDI